MTRASIDYPEGHFDSDWEKVTYETYRLKVEGGYLYRHSPEYRDASTMVFVPQASLAGAK